MGRSGARAAAVMVGWALCLGPVGSSLAAPSFPATLDDAVPAASVTTVEEPALVTLEELLAAQPTPTPPRELAEALLIADAADIPERLGSTSNPSTEGPDIPRPPPAGLADAPVQRAGDALHIPTIALGAYRNAEAFASGVAPGCRVSWQVLAGIGQVESGHARHGGAGVAADGQVAPRIIGPRLDGGAEVAAIRDTDRGHWDGDDQWDRAVGPMQFIPSSWRRFGQDANGDAQADPHNIYDATLGAVAHLCGTAPGDYDDPAQLARALFAYNHSDAYVRIVMAWISAYRSADLTAIASPATTATFDAPPPVAADGREEPDEKRGERPGHGSGKERELAGGDRDQRKRTTERRPDGDAGKDSSDDSDRRTPDRSGPDTKTKAGSDKTGDRSGSSPQDPSKGKNGQSSGAKDGVDDNNEGTTDSASEGAGPDLGGDTDPEAEDPAAGDTDAGDTDDDGEDDPAEEPDDPAGEDGGATGPIVTVLVPEDPDDPDGRHHLARFADACQPPAAELLVVSFVDAVNAGHWEAAQSLLSGELADPDITIDDLQEAAATDVPVTLSEVLLDYDGDGLANSVGLTLSVAPPETVDEPEAGETEATATEEPEEPTTEPTARPWGTGTLDCATGKLATFTLAATDDREDPGEE